jgi:hypothetical protein
LTASDNFVDAGLALSGLELDGAAVLRVKIEFARIAAIAAVLDSDLLGFHIEPASTFSC